MDRRAFLGTIAGGLFAAPLAADAQQAGKPVRVGLLSFGPQQTAQSPLDAALRERGWVEGQNLVMERRFGESADQLHASAAELVRLKVDVLVVPSCGLAKIAQGETKVVCRSGLASGVHGMGPVKSPRGMKDRIQALKPGGRNRKPSTRFSPRSIGHSSDV
jgi:hypothetical protein